MQFYPCYNLLEIQSYITAHSQPQLNFHLPCLAWRSKIGNGILDNFGLVIRSPPSGPSHTGKKRKKQIKQTNKRKEKEREGEKKFETCYPTTVHLNHITSKVEKCICSGTTQIDRRVLKQNYVQLVQTTRNVNGILNISTTVTFNMEHAQSRVKKKDLFRTKLHISGFFGALHKCVPYLSEKKLFLSPPPFWKL